MGTTEYADALKLGKKEYKYRVSLGQFPYLPVLDEIVSQADVQTEQNMGLVHIPLEFVVGTSTMGRTYAFAANFMPILEDGTEFSIKWANLADAQLNEGIRDPIRVYEYMNRYYVVEGNKRVSVLKFFNAVSIPAYVTRKIPKYSEDKEVKLYYEYMKFNEVTGLFTLEFTRLGNAQKLLNMIGKTTRWEDEDREKFNKILFNFSRAFEFAGGKRLPIKAGDAITTFMSVFGYERMLEMTEQEYKTNIIRVWAEFSVSSEKQNVDLVMNPTNVQEKKSLLRYFIPTSQKKFTVAFLFPKNPEESDFLYGHELGRNYLEDTFSDEMKTICVNNVDESNLDRVLKDVIKQDASVIFCLGPQMMKGSLKVAIENPNVKILNCSLNAPHPYVRTYYGRLYEAKFLTGMIAGALADNNKVAYIADYPIYGMIANINAFALGVACTNPRAKVYLAWSTEKDFDRNKFLMDNDLHYVSDQEMITPNDASRQFGFYKYDDGKATNLAMPIWNWGVFYEKLLQSILAGAYQNEASSENKALNYWWGMSAGVIDLICSAHVPYGVSRMVDRLKEDICSGEFKPFSGVIKDQSGRIRNKDHKEMKPVDIMNMDFLVENIVGTIPSADSLIEKAQGIVEVTGVEEAK